MNDAGDSQNASGSWQPDPTGRYKLRWRDASGDWTDHVYSDDGKMGSDPYDAPTEQPPPQGLPTPPTEPTGAEQAERLEASDTGPSTVVCSRCGHTDFVVKRDRVLWHVCFWLLLWYVLPFLRKRPYCARCGMRGEWLPPTDGKKPKPPIYRRWWAFVTYGFVILVVIANLVADEDEEPAEPAPSIEQAPSESNPATAAPTTTAPTATAAPTTTAPTTTTTLPPTTTTLTVKDVFEDCMDPWDGNYNALEALIRDVLNDPGSMETHGTYYFTTDDLDDGLVTVRLDYGARNLYGGMVRTSAWAEMRPDCSVAEVIDYGF